MAKRLGDLSHAAAELGYRALFPTSSCWLTGQRAAMDEDALDYDPFSLEVRDNPYLLYQRLRNEQPLYRSSKYDFWALSRFDDVQQTSRNWQAFSNSHGVDLDRSGGAIYGSGNVGNFLDSDPPIHTAFRKLLKHEFLTARITRALAPHVDSVVTTLLDDLQDHDEVDLIADFAWLLPTTVMWTWLGCPANDFTILRELLRRVKFRELGVPSVTPLAALAITELREYMRDLISSRQKRPTEDLISYLLREVETTAEGDVNEVTLGISMLLIDAGTGTTAALLGNALHLLGGNTARRQELLAHPEKVRIAVEEVIRLESPVQHNVRTTTQVVDFYGQQLPAGSRVLLVYGAANRDERRWQDAEAFDLNRPSLPHLGFGHGIHLCLGAPLARLEATAALSEFLRRFPDYELGTKPVRLPNLDRGFLSLPASPGLHRATKSRRHAPESRSTAAPVVPAQSAGVDGTSSALRVRPLEARLRPGPV